MITTASIPRLFLLSIVFGAMGLGEKLVAQGNVSRVADREVARRQAALPQGTEALARGQAAMTQQNFTVAHEEFKAAVSYLPDAVVGGKAHDEAVAGFCASGVRLA
ncbi:MAG: hypothetical protein ABI871_01020, partial [Chthoniobacterales bacterium]